MALTDTEVRKARTSDKARKISNGKGLFLFVTLTGGKLWRWKYRHESKEKLISLGSTQMFPTSLQRHRILDYFQYQHNSGSNKR